MKRRLPLGNEKVKTKQTKISLFRHIGGSSCIGKTNVLNVVPDAAQLALDRLSAKQAVADSARLKKNNLQIQREMEYLESNGCEPKIQKYLVDPAPIGFFGTCSFSNKDRVKEMGGKWDPEQRSWAAPNLRTLIAMLREKVFVVGHLIETDLLEQAKRLDAYRLNHAHSLAGTVSAPIQKRGHVHKMLDDSPVDLLSLNESHGLGVEVIAAFNFLEIGPRVGLSGSARLLRAIELGIVDLSAVQASYAAFVAGDIELDALYHLVVASGLR